MRGEVAALITAGCWTVTAMSFESAGRRIGSLPVNIIRLVLAFLFLSVFCLVTRGLVLPTDADGRAWLWLVLSGIVGFTIGDLCLFRSFILIGSRTSMLLMSLVPAMTALAGMAVGETMTPRQWLGLIVTGAGVALAISEKRKDANGQHQPLHKGGVLLGLGAAMGQAGGLVLSKYGMRDYDPFAATQIRVMAGIAGFSLIFAVAGIWPRVIEGLKDRAAMARVGLGAFFGPFLGVSFSLMAVQRTHSGVAATIMSITPILIILPAAILFKEKITPHAVIGAVVAFAGVAILFT